MARVIIHDGKKKVLVKVQYALDRDHLILAILEDAIGLGTRPKNKRQCLEIAKQYFYRNGIQSGTSLADDDYRKHLPEATATVDRFFPELK